MTVRDRQIPITSPCPIDLDRSGVAPEDREMFCEHCTKEVHLLSNMTEAEVRELMRERAGEDICVSYAMASDGAIRFRPEPKPELVPAARLVRPRPAAARFGASMAASLGTAALLAACTPHSDAKPDEEQPVIEVVEEVEEPPVPPPVAGGITAHEIPEEPCDEDKDKDKLDPTGDIVVDGGLRAEPIEEPPPVPKLDEAIGTGKKVPHRRGGVRARPIEPKDKLEL